jgi:urease accessory protein
LTSVIADTSLLRLLQLASPAFPIGAYAYSQGLEWAVESGAVRDETEATQWIGSQLHANLARLDVPVLVRLYEAWQTNDTDTVEAWSAFLYASRESRELRAESRQTGCSAAQVLVSLGLAEAAGWASKPHTSVATMFALAAARWCIPVESMALAYLWAWAENQTTCAIKLVPLGQTAGQRILSAAIEVIPRAAAAGLAVADDDIGYIAPALAIACARHETQYSRLFRS